MEEMSERRKEILLIVTASLVLSTAFFTVVWFIGKPIAEYFWIIVMIGLCLILAGRYLKRNETTRIIGISLQWTFSSILILLVAAFIILVIMMQHGG
jgi:phosphate/sulfate permease